MRFRIKNTKTTLKIIGIYQILGGVLGLGITGWLLMRVEEINGPVFLIFLFAIGLYCFSIHSGSLVLQKSRMKIGIIYSMILHAVQLFAISTGDYKYEYYSGAKGTVGFDFTKGFEFNFGLGISEFNFSINSDSGEFFLFINIFAIFGLLILRDIYKELFSNKIEDNIPDKTQNIKSEMENNEIQRP